MDGARYIATLAGRGYCFVAPISRSGDRDNVNAEVVDSFPQRHLPSRLLRMVGRDDDVLELTTQVKAARLDRKSVVEGKSVSVRVVLGCRRIIKKKKKKI